MAADIQDLITQATDGTRPSPTTLASIMNASDTTITCDALTGWPIATAVHFIIYTTDVNGTKVPGSQSDWKGIVSGSDITNLQLMAGTDSGYPIGAIVEASPTAMWANDLAEALLAHLDQDGTLKANAVDVAAVLASNVVTTAKILDSNVTTAKIADSNVTNAKVADGFMVQTVSATFNATSTGSTIIPKDDTIPQNTEGDEYMTISITPKSATNILEIVVNATFARGSAGAATVALFQDSTANALAAVPTRTDTADFAQTETLIHRMVAGTTSSTTFKVRIGPTSGSIRFNGEAGARLYGDIPKSGIVIHEYKAS